MGESISIRKLNESRSTTGNRIHVKYHGRKILWSLRQDDVRNFVLNTCARVPSVLWLLSTYFVFPFGRTKSAVKFLKLIFKYVNAMLTRGRKLTSSIDCLRFFLHASFPSSFTRGIRAPRRWRMKHNAENWNYSSILPSIESRWNEIYTSRIPSDSSTTSDVILLSKIR